MGGRELLLSRYLTYPKLCSRVQSGGITKETIIETRRGPDCGRDREDDGDIGTSNLLGCGRGFRGSLRDRGCWRLVSNVDSFRSRETKGLLGIDWIPVERVPSLYLELGVPAGGIGRLATGHEGAGAVLRAGVAHVEVEPTIVPALHQAMKVASELRVPAIDLPVLVQLDCFDLADFAHGHDDPSNDDGVDVDAALLSGPDVAEKLCSHVPLFGPVGFESTGGFFVANNGAIVVEPKKISTADIDKRVSGNRMARKLRPVKRDSEAEFKSRLAVQKERLNRIRLRRVGGDVVLNGIPHILLCFTGFFLRREVAPKIQKGVVGAGEGDVFGLVVDPGFSIKAFDRAAKGAAGVEING